MDEALVVQTRYRPRAASDRCFEMLASLGFKTVKASGHADVGFAKNVVFSKALHNRREEKALVHIDDDMHFSPQDVRELVAGCLKKNRPVSGAYVSDEGTPVLMKWGNKFLTGTGFFAVPFDTLEELARQSQSLMYKGNQVWALTWSGPGHGSWLSSDYRLCSRLGGVELLPIAVGHVKETILRPTDEQINKWRELGDQAVQNA